MTINSHTVKIHLSPLVRLHSAFGVSTARWLSGVEVTTYRSVPVTFI